MASAAAPDMAAVATNVSAAPSAAIAAAPARSIGAKAPAIAPNAISPAAKSARAICAAGPALAICVAAWTMIRHPVAARTVEAPNAISPTDAAVSAGPSAPATAIIAIIPTSMIVSAAIAIGPAAATCVAAIVMRLIPAAAIRTAPPNARSPADAPASCGPIAPATANSAMMPPSMSARLANAIGPAAATCVAAIAIKLIPAPAIKIAPPNARRPCVPACSFGASCAATAINAIMPPAIRTVAICAPGPAAASSLAAFTNIHTPAAAAANPIPNPSAFLAAADITLLPSLSGALMPLVFFPMLPIAFPTLPNVPTRDPAILNSRPPISRTGPAAAAIPTHFTMFFCIDGSRLLNLSISPVKLSTKGFRTSLEIPPTVYFITSKDEFSFSRDPPIPDRSESAIFCELPAAPSSELAYFCT